MIGEIIDSLRSFTGAMKKEQVERYVDLLFKILNDELLTSFQVITQDKDIQVIKKNTYLTNFYKQADIKASNNFEALVKMESFFKEMSKAESTIRKLTDKHISKVIANTSIKAKDGAIIKILTDCFSMVSYTLDFLYFIIVDEKHSELPKIKFNKIREGLVNYITLYKTYSKYFDKMLVDVTNIPDEEFELEIDEVKQQMKEMIIAQNSKLVTLPVSGFIGNPIYHFRMWLVDRDFKEIEDLKIKKQLIELKLMELKLKEKNEEDANLTKQIAYYEDKLTSIEYKIEKLQK